MFEQALRTQNMNKLEELYQSNPRNNYYLDISIEEGNLEIADFFIQKGIKPSLFALQMARINSHHSLANKIESIADLRNKVNIKSVYWKYLPKNKSTYWNDIVPKYFQF